MLHTASPIRPGAAGLQAGLDDRMEFTRGGGWVMVLGFVPLLIGISGFYRTLSGGLLGGSGLDGLADLGGGLLFLGIAAALIFGRHGYVLDRAAGQVTFWWGLLRPWKSHTRPLSEFDRIGLERRIVRNGKSSQRVFPVELQGSGAAINLVQPVAYETAREKAEAVAKFLGLPLHDASTGSLSVRQAEGLDRSLRAQALHAGETAEWPELPADSKIQYRTEGENAVIELPPSRIAALKRAFQIVGVLIGMDVGLFTIAFLLAPGVPRGFLIFGLVLALLGSAGAAGVLVLRPPPLIQGKGERIVVSARELRRHADSMGKALIETIPAAELEELLYEETVEHPILSTLGLSAGLIARSDRQTVRFGAGLTAAERLWLHDVIRYIIIDAPNDSAESSEPELCASA